MGGWRKISIFLVLFVAFIFSFFRFLFFLFYLKGTSPLAFLDGIRFDFFAILPFWVLPLFILNFPFKLPKALYLVSLWYIYITILVFVAILIFDFIFFGQTQKHISVEILTISSDWDFIFKSILSEWKYLILFLIFGFVLGYFWYRLTKNINFRDETWNLPSRSFYFVVIIALILLGLRGTLSSKPLHIVDAFTRGMQYGNLVLNGVFSIYTTFYSNKNLKNRNLKTNFFGYDEDISILKIEPIFRSYPFKKISNCEKNNKEIGGSKQIMENQKYDIQKYNVVLFILESWTPKYIDSLSYEKWGITPNFDKIVEKGITYEKFYSAGVRSAIGIQAILTGIPSLPNLPYVGHGLDGIAFRGIGDIVKKYGYKTIFVQSSKRRSYRLDSVAKVSGFDYAFGMEDIRKEVGPLLDYPPGPPPHFGWDYETLVFLFRKIQSFGEPFLAVVFTGTTHARFADLPKNFKKYEHSEMGLGGYLNTLFYSDWALGEFMKMAEKTRWFERTIFIFMADHPAFTSGDFRERFHIPFVIFAPSIFSPERIKDVVGSQYDIIPTIVDLLCIDAEFSSIGKSIFRKTKDDFVFVSDGDIIGAITNYGFISHSTFGVVETNISGSDLQNLERRLLALFELSYYAIMNNRWF
jgi:phosphoglycerol transferase MdoB-like AlkP superfamily enzyme